MALHTDEVLLLLLLDEVELELFEPNRAEMAEACDSDMPKLVRSDLSRVLESELVDELVPSSVLALPPFIDLRTDSALLPVMPALLSACSMRSPGEPCSVELPPWPRSAPPLSSFNTALASLALSPAPVSFDSRAVPFEWCDLLLLLTFDAFDELMERLMVCLFSKKG
jgi:hypothetical protein